MKSVDGRMDDGPWLYYKLTNEPKGSGELTKGTFWLPKLFDFAELFLFRSFTSDSSMFKQRRVIHKTSR